MDYFPLRPCPLPFAFCSSLGDRAGVFSLTRLVLDLSFSIYLMTVEGKSRHLGNLLKEGTQGSREISGVPGQKRKTRPPVSEASMKLSGLENYVTRITAGLLYDAPRS